MIAKFESLIRWHPYELLKWIICWLVVLGVVLLVSIIYVRRKKFNKDYSRYICIFNIYLSVILLLTLALRERANTFKYNIIPFRSYIAILEGKKFFLEEIIENILLFIPFGYLLSFRKNASLIRIVVISFVVSLSIETIQLVFRIGMFEVDDILHNSLGGLLGYLLYMKKKKEVEQ